jgi:hypothetical protein
MNAHALLDTLTAASLDEFLRAPFEMWAVYALYSGQVSDPKIRRDADR